MNREVIETQWSQVRDSLGDKFTNLTDEDIRQINGRYDQLIAKLQQRYGYTREEAEERIRSWNFDRFGNSRTQVTRDERRIRREEDTSSALKWLLALGIPLLLLGAYFLSGDRTEQTPAYTQDQFVVETPADRSISNAVRNTLISQPGIASEIQNVQINTRNGIVTLNGTVSSQEASNTIAQRAQNISGVRQVINNLQIR